jgi:hypothetical protein
MWLSAAVNSVSEDEHFIIDHPDSTGPRFFVRVPVAAYISRRNHTSSNSSGGGGGAGSSSSMSSSGTIM